MDDLALAILNENDWRLSEALNHNMVLRNAVVLFLQGQQPAVPHVDDWLVPGVPPPGVEIPNADEAEINVGNQLAADPADLVLLPVGGPPGGNHGGHMHPPGGEPDDEEMGGRRRSRRRSRRRRRRRRSRRRST